MRARLGRDPDTRRLRPADLVQRGGRREMDHMDRRIGGPRERQRASRRDRLDVRWPGAGVERGAMSPRSARRHGRVEQHRVLAMDLEHAAAPAHERHRVVQRAIGAAGSRTP